MRQILLGCFGRAYHRYPELNLHVISVLSNHGCFLASPESSFVLSSFMRDFLSDLGKRINAHRRRDGVVFERRYRSIPVLDEAAMEDRFRYVLTQGTKENLVRSSRDWPGVNSVHALLGGAKLLGKWRDRTAESALRRQRIRKLERAKVRGKCLQIELPPLVWREYGIPLVPMPHWRDLEPCEIHERVANIVAHDDEVTRRRHKSEKTNAIGVKAILGVDPFSRPSKPDKSPAPFCHASFRMARQAFRRVYNAFTDLLVQAREMLGLTAERIGVPIDGTLGALNNICTQSVRLPHPPLVQGGWAEILLGTPAIGPPEEY